MSDQRNNPKWNYYVKKVEKTNKRVGIGAEYLQVRKRDEQMIRVEEYLEYERIVIGTLPGERPAAVRKLTLSGDEQQTTIKDQIELRTPIPSFLSRLFVRVPQTAVKQNLQKLKTLLEEGQVILQDNREVFL